MRIQTPADLARIVKTRRQAQKLTQQNVADAVGITRQSLARVERGHGGVSFDTVLRIFDVLDIQLDTTTAASNQSHSVIPSLSTTFGLSQQLAASAQAAARNSNVSPSALEAYRSMLQSPAIAAATAAFRNIYTPTRLPLPQAELNKLTAQIQEATQRTGAELAARDLRRALNAAIETGDPDRKDLKPPKDVRAPETPDGVKDD